MTTKIYKVTFDTQRNRRYITWAFYVSARNQKDAKSIATEAWLSDDNRHYAHVEKPHMFHLSAERVEQTDRPERTFQIEKDRFASWG